MHRNPHRADEVLPAAFAAHIFPFGCVIHTLQQVLVCSGLFLRQSGNAVKSPPVCKCDVIAKFLDGGDIRGLGKALAGGYRQDVYFTLPGEPQSLAVASGKHLGIAGEQSGHGLAAGIIGYTLQLQRICAGCLNNHCRYKMVHAALYRTAGYFDGVGILLEILDNLVKCGVLRILRYNKSSIVRNYRSNGGEGSERLWKNTGK